MYRYGDPIATSVIAKKTSASLLRSESRTVFSEHGRHYGFGVAEAVADAAHGEQVLGVLGVALDLFAQVADVDIDRARVAVGGVTPDAGQEHVAREYPARGAGQRREDLELDVGQLGVLAADAHRSLGEVDPQRPDLQRGLVGGRSQPAGSSRRGAGRP